MTKVDEHTAAPIRPGRTQSALPAVPTDPRLEQILLVDDGGIAGGFAALWVADRAKAHVIDVNVAIVVDVHWLDSFARGSARRDEADAALTRITDRLKWAAPSVEVFQTVIDGVPLETLEVLATEADLLVAATNRVGPFTGHLFATLSTHLAELAPCPVVLVPRGWTPADGPVVVAFIGDGSDTEAIAFAAHEAATLRRELVFVHAQDLTGALSPGRELWSSDGPLERGQKLDHAAASIRRRYPGLVVTTSLVSSVRALAHAGRRASLLVLGSHDLSTAERWLRNSVGRALVERPPCPVAVVPPRGSLMEAASMSNVRA